MKGSVFRTIMAGLLAGCMLVTPVSYAYAQGDLAEVPAETTVLGSQLDLEEIEGAIQEEAADESEEVQDSEALTEADEVIPAEEAEMEAFEAAYNDPVKNFVARLYQNILNRKPDESGLNAWTDVLKSGREQGVKVAQGFIESKEFQSRKMDDTTYIKILYSTFLDRNADAAGLKAWQAVLDSGLSRMHVFRGFAESKEFTDICQRYGIQRGNAVLNAPMDQNEGVTKFVVRSYRLCLGRNADEGGLNAWCNALLTGSNTAKEVAHGFFFSDEFLKNGLSDSEYVTLLYKVLMDRTPDNGGLNAWCNVLYNGESREAVFNQFADSEEFQGICNRYGIRSGSGSYVGIGTIDAVSYTNSYQSLPGSLHMSQTGDEAFGGSGHGYITENGFYLSYTDDGNFAMLNMGAKDVTLEGVALGTDADTFHIQLTNRGWEPGYYYENGDDTIFGYARVINGRGHLIELYVEASGQVIEWVLDNCPSEDEAQYFECLK